MNRRTNAIVLFLVVFVAAVLVAVLFRSLQQGSPTGPATSLGIHLVMGNPSGATDDPANRDNFLMRKPDFVLSYNNSKGTPNWVSWRLTADDIGSAPRGKFEPDLELPSGFKQVYPRDYISTGFDRGHMCPAGDRSRTTAMSQGTFVMTNIIAQSPACNQKAWADLEEYLRELARHRGQTLYIVAGPQGEGGEGSRGRADTIAGGKVTVPAKCWKVALILPGAPSEDDAARVSSEARLVAAIMPNDESVGHGWAKCRTSAVAVEALTGYRFFDRVPAGIIGPLKAQVDREPIRPPRPRRMEE